MIKALAITLAIFILLLGISIFICVMLGKSLKKWKKSAKEWEQSYKNIKNLYDEVSEIRSEYEEKENNIEPTGNSYNDIVSDFAEGGKSKDTAKTKPGKNK